MPLLPDCVKEDASLNERGFPSRDLQTGRRHYKRRIAMRTVMSTLAIATAAAQPPIHPVKRRCGVAGGAENCPGMVGLPGDASVRSLQELGGGNSEKLRRQILEGYDKGAYPWEYAWAQRGYNSTTGSGIPRKGLPVEVGINFHRVFSVDVRNSVADVVAWFRLRWTDPRLAWDPEDFDGLTTTWFWIGDGVAGGETSEIWTPDIKLWNMESSLSDTLADSYATVDSSGTVYWSRPGHLRPACKFEGLDSFPFDLLKCTMEFGSWSYSGLYLRPVKLDEGFTLGGSETAGEAFAEYQLADKDAVVVREHVYPPYPSLPEEDWPVLMYDVTFHRSWQPYVRGYVLLQIILNFCGFGCFWLPVPAGERVGLAITALLAAVASELVVSESLPTAAEMTWFQTFSLFSLAFAAFCVFESVAVIYFFYYTGGTLVPRWWRWFQERVASWWKRLRNPDAAKESAAAEKAKSSQTGESTPDRNSEPPHQMAADADVENGHWDLDPVSSASSKSGKDDMVPISGTTTESARNVHFRDENGNEGMGLPMMDHHRQSSLRRASVWSHGSIRGHDADDFKDSIAAQNNKRWQKVANSTDEACRVLIPILYLIILTILLRQVDYM